ncbi:hypothetical protein EVAR_18540_1 [Eumeta japonica]|uniref:Uncharacterized protein n=1 Tax=Eumeta variegata TaxID=151549 RepID=A0A4C1V466_EUMVA|nr:hypothetical protein EVAR_18540_1 [Eumeta japonica]
MALSLRLKINTNKFTNLIPVIFKPRSTNWKRPPRSDYAMIELYHEHHRLPHTRDFAASPDDNSYRVAVARALDRPAGAPHGRLKCVPRPPADPMFEMI